ncbi:jg17900 [Pararge aegeria aegeria]|uniref:Jg17900 protein n=1 Tax=Pararge aegeria aegeria TaxID=348720 RepID=A0A8S4SPB3_9NEOP|nr:jg17900 [Pararge aegeria aegeria]
MGTNTVQFEYDPERLIEEVKKRPGIWDFEHVEYRAKNKRHQLWSEVVNTLMTGDVKISKSEMRELELQLQKKWKSIRDCFQKYISHPNRTKRPYLYARHLNFLKLQKSTQDPQEVGSSDSDDERRSKRVWKPKKKLRITRPSSDDDNDALDNDDYRSNEDVQIEIPLKNTSTNKHSLIDEFAFASVDQSRNEPEDPDKFSPNEITMGITSHEAVVAMGGAHSSEKL